MEGHQPSHVTNQGNQYKFNIKGTYGLWPIYTQLKEEIINTMLAFMYFPQKSSYYLMANHSLLCRRISVAMWLSSIDNLAHLLLVLFS